MTIISYHMHARNQTPRLYFYIRKAKFLWGQVARQAPGARSGIRPVPQTAFRFCLCGWYYLRAYVRSVYAYYYLWATTPPTAQAICEYEEHKALDEAAK